MKSPAMADRVKLTFQENLILKKLQDGPQLDCDRTSERFLIGSGLAERFGIGKMQITESGRALLASDAGKGM